jgi:hypothetical protein
MTRAAFARRASASVSSLAAVAAIGALTAITSAQIGGKPVTGNPTPGVAQPDPPNPANRVTFVGCLHALARRAEASASATADANTPSNARFELTKAERSEHKTYRLEGIDSQFSPFVGSKVEITGEIKGPASANPPTLLVEFVQRLSAKCS